ncbi:ShlB/FhaC/HecB family hemolysin secretion/activation protein [Aquicoccus sp. G2-2]|uniref:ShlB/FhaC/HecB family hemolysin secretion/activation protein n=1 Tax=Aquicoccus sp. G2-2 TaxID=3092120 RepID=UPI002AE01625|nr:ShlB/FhaC/HecB family hemolysin secretion/activation protein [Aquicoccus sp. G2-2]MEA1112283.1 ShlB/FhaC/HecB family hemolysin secretion/activation protein [Aquicoccus sp. G2-2]
MSNSSRYLPIAAVAVFVAGCSLIGGTPVSAQAVTPQQGNIQGKIAQQTREKLQERDAESRVKQQGPAVVTDPLNRRELPAPGGPTVLLKSVAFEPGSAFLTRAELDGIAGKYQGKRVDFSQISELVRDVNDLYAEKGIVTAAAILPPQQLSDGTLEVRLVEGQVGKVALVGEHQTKNEFIFDRVTLAKGTTVDVPTASKDIQRFNAVNRAQLRMLLQPGASFGYTDLLLGITEPPKHELQFYLDNEGVASTGRGQLSTLYRRYGLLGVDDTLLAYVATSEGSTAATLRYEFPINTHGTRLAASVTASKVNVVHGPTKVLNITGDSKSANLTLSHPLFVNENWTVLGTAAAFYGTSSSKSATVPLVDSKTTKLAPGVTLSYSGDKAAMTTQVQGVFAKATDNIAGSTRDIFLLAGSFSGQYYLENGFSLVGTGAWQHTSAKLVPGNLLFQIGGPTTVRGYPSDGVAGDSGYYASMEVHKQFNMPHGVPLDGYLFTDFGTVYSTFPKHTNLVSAGVGANYNLNDRVKLSLSVAAPLKQSVTNQSDYVVSAMMTFNAF